MSTERTPAEVRCNAELGPLPTSAEDVAAVLARLAKTPAEAYERGYIDGAARERERCESMRQALLKCKTCALPTEVRDLVNAALRA